MRLIIIFFGIALSISAEASEYMLGPDANSDAQLKSITNKSSRNNLNLGNITDVGMAALKDFSGLQRLTITSAELTDRGLAYLKPLHQLSDLSLLNTKITGTGFKDLGSLEQMKQLHLDGSPIRDEALQWIARSKNLETLSLSGTFVTGSGLAYLKNLTNLRELNLSKSDIDDSKINAVQDLPALRALNVSETHLSDASVNVLEKLSHIESLSLTGTSISKDGYRQLRTALPSATIRPPNMRMVSPNSPEDLWWNVVKSCLNGSSNEGFKTKISNGGQALAQKKYQQAIEYYSSALEDSKSDQSRCWFSEAASLSLLADAHRQAGNIKQAKSLYEKVLTQISNGPYGDQFPAIKLVKQIIGKIDNGKP